MTSYDSIQSGVAQLLEHWNRCGLNHLPQGDERVSAAWPVVAESELLVGSASKSLSQNRIDSSASVTSAAPVVSTDKDRKTAVEPLSLEAGPSQKPKLPTAPRESIPLLVERGRKVSPAIASTRGQSDHEDNREDATWRTPKTAGPLRDGLFANLALTIESCQRCQELACTRARTVFGEGAPTAKIVFLGEAPGQEEDATGRPFVGPAGQLLNKILIASQMPRESVFILNSVKCRPPKNRNPMDVEVENCRTYLEQQLEWIQPDYIVSLGAIAMRALLRTNASVGQMRGRFHRYRGARVLVTYHPSYLLRTESAKKLTWEDMKLLMKELNLAVPQSRGANSSTSSN